MDPKRASHRLSWLLRHGANKTRLPMDAAGWAPVDAVCRTLNLDRALLEVVVRTNNKRRLELCDDRVRASQGHSIDGCPVTVEALEASWRRLDPDHPTVWHGTRAALEPTLRTDGIAPMGRTHVHLAASPESRVGKRANVGVLIAVEPACLARHGLGLFESPNGVILARRVPPDCLGPSRSPAR